MPGVKQSIQMDLVSGLVSFYLMLIVVVAFSILNTFLMAVFERTREFGVMLAMGMPRPGPPGQAGPPLVESRFHDARCAPFLRAWRVLGIDP